ncbi:hypothetical protein EDD85DRAFT_934305 [Armillaria nabsnona]|nr:hypothetical protein EDD85DRAFT_934305 [Armillaria nabsnona]
MSYVSLDEPSDPTPMSPSPSRSQDYYWENVVLQVEDTLFRIPKQHLVGKSEAFDSMLSLPQGGSEPEGVSDDRPIQLSGIKKIDFERLLQVLHPMHNRDTMKQPELPVNGWVSVLALSSLWIVLGRKYSVAQWVSSGYEELASRVESVSLEEGERVGWSTALRIEHIRESNFKDHLQQAGGPGSYYCGQCCRYHPCVQMYPSGQPFNLHTVKEKVGRHFEAELKDVEAEGAGYE